MLAGGIDHQVEMVASVGDHEIVLEPALVIGEQPVALAAGLEAATSTGVMASARVPRRDIAAFGADQDLPHMRDVEQPGIGAGVKMLLHHAHRVLDRHVVTGKRHHARAEFEMQGMKRCFQKVCGGVHAPVSISGAGKRRARANLQALNAFQQAPSVLLPEIVIPSAGANAPFSRVRLIPLVLLPESFRGGCSFGTGPRVRALPLGSMS
jgi:hypothetical protein